MSKFLKVDQIKGDGEILKCFIDVQKIKMLGRIPINTKIFMYEDEDKKFNLHKNGYKTMISLNENLNVLNFCCKLSFEELIEKCDIEIIE
jgi:hypothetical protein